MNEVPKWEQGKAALTQLFDALKIDDTPIIVDNIVNRIVEVVRGVRFDGWQSKIHGNQEVRQALRKTLFVQFKIRDNDVFEKALGTAVDLAQSSRAGSEPVNPGSRYASAQIYFTWRGRVHRFGACDLRRKRAPI